MRCIGICFFAFLVCSAVARHNIGSGSFDPKDYGWYEQAIIQGNDVNDANSGSGTYNALNQEKEPPSPPPKPPPSPSPPTPPRPPPSPRPPRPPNPPPPPMMDVWILAGQSNMVGENSFDDQTPPRPWAIPNDEMFMFPMNPSHPMRNGWQRAQNNMGAISHGCNWCTGNNAGVGPEVAFAHTLLTNNVTKRIGFIPTAVGGTTLSWAWNPSTGLEYKNMVKAVHQAMTANPEQPKRLRGIIWVQGESDALEFSTSANYGMNLWNLIHESRNALRAYHPALPWVVTKMAVQGRARLLPFIESVRAGQEAMAWGIPNIVMVDMEGMEFYMQYYSGGMHPLHLSKRGACQLGRAMGEAWVHSNL